MLVQLCDVEPLKALSLLFVGQKERRQRVVRRCWQQMEEDMFFQPLMQLSQRFNGGGVGLLFFCLSEPLQSPLLTTSKPSFISNVYSSSGQMTQCRNISFLLFGGHTDSIPGDLWTLRAAAFTAAIGRLRTSSTPLQVRTFDLLFLEHHWFHHPWVTLRTSLDNFENILG